MAHSDNNASVQAAVIEHIAQVPPSIRPLFDELRALMKTELPNAKEVVSYGVIGYKIDDKRPRAFIGGWNDHLALYPVPHDETLQADVAPYRKGKGTLWFLPGVPLPKPLIRRVIAALVK